MYLINQEEDMVKTFKKGLALATILTFAATGLACASEEVDVTVKVELDRSFDVTTTDLDFGIIDYTPGGGSVTLDAFGAASTAGTLSDATNLAGSGTPLFGSIEVTALDGVVITATYSDPVTLTSTGNSFSVTVEDIEDNSDTTKTTASNTATLYVGGTLVIPEQADDEDWDEDYEGTMTVTLDFE